MYPERHCPKIELISILVNYMHASLKFFYIGQPIFSKAHKVGNNGVNANVAWSYKVADFIGLFNFELHSQSWHSYVVERSMAIPN